MRKVLISRKTWERGDLLEVDRQIHAAQDDGTSFGVFAAPSIHAEVALRYQRLCPVANDASRTEAFADLLARHRALHDLRLPLVRADHEHALDTWQWVLRLAPDAPAELQLAGLLHDLERVRSEPRQRIEHLAPSYQRFKDIHAERGAELVWSLLAGGPWDAEQVAGLVRTHERRSTNPDAQLLADADVLSFFALNSPGYLRYYGAQVTRRKVRYSLARGSERIGPWMGRVRLHPLVRDMVEEVVVPRLAC